MEKIGLDNVFTIEQRDEINVVYLSIARSTQHRLLLLLLLLLLVFSMRFLLSMLQYTRSA